MSLQPGAPKRIVLDHGFARLTLTGSLTVPILVLALREAMEECQALGQSRLLVDTRAGRNPPLSTVDRLELSDDVADFWDRSILLCMLAREDQMDSRRFGQKVARNRGLTVGAYADEASAIQWLLGARRSGLPDGPVRP